MKKVIEKAKKFALKEVEKYHSPNITHFEIANKMGQILAKKHKADKDIVMLGTIFMDCKIGQALHEGRLKDHVQISADTAIKFLQKEKVEEKTIDDVVNCVLSHHRDIAFASLEAEVCANADCYRFLTTRGALSFIAQLGKEESDLNKIFDYLESKLEEKRKIITFKDVKEELEPNYKQLKKLVLQAKKVK
jgi:HD superfamily phosphodiesterase